MIYDAITVGGGIAGLTAAAYLADQGFQTLLLERAETTGGLLAGIKREGFTFDRGAKVFENQGIIIPMLRNLGLDGQLRFIENRVCMQIKDRQVVLSEADGPERLGEVLASYFPEDTEAIARIVALLNTVRADMSVIFSLDHPLFLEDNTIKGSDYLREVLLPWLAEYQQSEMSMARLTSDVHRYLGQYTGDEALVDMLTQHVFRGTPTYFALSHFGYYPESIYPEGGTSRLPEVLTEAAANRGAEIRTQAEVVEIDPGRKRVITADGAIYHYKKLIWAADQRKMYRALQAASTPASSIQTWQVELGHGSESYLSLLLALDRDPADLNGLAPHTFYSASTEGVSSLLKRRPGYSKDWEERLERYLRLTTYEISCPVLRDPALAPTGKTGLIVSTIMDHRLVADLEARGEYVRFKALCERIIPEVLGAELLPGLEEELRFADLLTPLDYAETSGSLDGAVAGFSFAARTLPVEKRYTKIIRSIDTAVDDIWQCGQWVFSPGCVATSILTGKLAADQAAKTLKQ